MKEQLINIETAKLAKEKGFDAPCAHGYNDLEEENSEYGLVRNWNHAYDNTSPKLTNKELKRAFTAPTQSLLQKWLREKHNIHIAIGRDYEKGNYSYEYFIDKNNQLFGLSSYEEALEIGLQEALKRIP